MVFLLVIGLFLATSLWHSEARVGICYGLLGDNLPSPEDVVTLFRDYNISRIRLYDPNPGVLGALRGTNIELMLGVPNVELVFIASSLTNAESWVLSNVMGYLPDVNFRYIVVGNEITPINDNSRFSPFVLPAMRNIHVMLSRLGVNRRVKVSSSFDASILGNSFPPSAGSFNPEVSGQFLHPILEFLSSNSAPLLVNVYPFFAYVNNIKDVRLDYALFTSPTDVVIDGELKYQNLFDAMLDSFYSALEKVGFGSMNVVVSETGWPSAGGTSTSVDNEQIYITNLIQHLKGGTPRKPDKRIETYMFAMFDENLKDGQETEKYFGLFHPNKQIKFPVVFN